MSKSKAERMEDVYNELAPDWRGIPTKGKGMMNEKEITALVSLLLYISNDGWQYRDSDRLVEILSDYVKGLYSTGNIK